MNQAFVLRSLLKPPRKPLLAARAYRSTPGIGGVLILPESHVDMGHWESHSWVYETLCKAMGDEISEHLGHSHPQMSAQVVSSPLKPVDEGIHGTVSGVLEGVGGPCPAVNSNIGGNRGKCSCRRIRGSGRRSVHTSWP